MTINVMLPNVRTGVTFTPYHTILIILLCLLTSVKSDDTIYDDNVDNTTAYNTQANTVEDPTPFIVATLLLSFSAIVSFVGVVVGYMSFKEDYLLQIYQKNGSTIVADVISFDYIRASLGSDEKIEFKVLVEYTVCLQENYFVRVQKQVKSAAPDFQSKPFASPLSLCNTNTFSQGSEKQLIATEFSFSDELKKAIGEKNNEEEYIHDIIHKTTPTNMNHYQQKYTLDLQVIPGLPKSGYPTKQIRRHSSCSYRSYTSFLLFLIFSIAALCLYVAITTMIDAGVLPDNTLYTKWSIVGFILTTFLEFILVYCCLDHMLSYVLEEEYLHHGDFVASYCDETSLSSGSDMLLNDPIPVWVKDFKGFIS